MRPRLRDDVRFVESPDGAYVHSDLGTCTLRGRQAFAWLSRLAPALTGHRTLAELTAGLPDDRREMVEGLVRNLAELRFVVDTRDARPHGLTAAELDAYADEISFIGYAHDSAEWRFERLRRARTVLAGDGPLLAALLEACVGSGWRHLRVLTTDTTADTASGTASDPVSLQNVVDRARRDPAQDVRIDPAGDPAEAVRDALADTPDLVLQISRDPAALLATARACHEAAVSLGQALVRPAEVWLTAVGPVARTEAESAWRRLAALPGATPAHTGEDRLIGPVPAVVAAMLALAAFSHLTGMDAADPEDRGTPAEPGRPDHAADPVPQPAVPYASPAGLPPGDGSAPALSRVDLRNLNTFRHGFLPHPGAGHRSRPGRTPEDVRAAVDTLASAEPLGRDRLLERTTEIVDSRLGLLGLLDEQDLAQTPLAVCRATVSDPFGVLPHWAPSPEAIGWGEDRPTARSRCLLAALATYGALAAPGALAAAEDHDGMVWGVEVLTGRPRAIPAGILRPAGGRYRAPIGAAAGLSWGEAVAAGLRAHCEAHLAALDPHDLPVVHPPSDHMGRQLELTGDPVEIRDATAALGVPAFRFGVPGRPAVVSAAATRAAALLDGRERVLLGWQAHTSGQIAYADPGPLRCAGPVTGDLPPDDPYGVRILAEALRAAGRNPVAIPLDHDPGLARLLPFVVQVVLADD